MLVLKYSNIEPKFSMDTDALLGFALYVCGLWMNKTVRFVLVLRRGGGLESKAALQRIICCRSRRSLYVSEKPNDQDSG